MFFKSSRGFTVIEIVIAVFILTIVIVPLLKIFSSSLSYAESAAYNTRALALAQESLEKIRYERDKKVRTNNKTGWHDFYTHFALQEPSGAAGTYDADPCTTGKRIRFINLIGNQEPSPAFRSVSTPENNGKFIVFTHEEDKEHVFLPGEKAANPIEFTREVFCRKIGTQFSYNSTPRAPEDVLEFIVQVHGEFQGLPTSTLLKMELSRGYEYQF